MLLDEPALGVRRARGNCSISTTLFAIETNQEWEE
jgi:hypothetical protein